MAIREAQAVDRDQLARSLAEAFLEEPTSVWAIPPESIRFDVLRRFFGAYLRLHEGEGRVWCDDALQGAAIWALPGHSKMSLGESISLLRSAAHPRLLHRAPLIALGGAMIERRHPQENDFFYLAVLGVAPSAQGQGLGSKLLAPVLEICESDRVPAYLESSKPENVDFYSRHGFRVVGEQRLPRGPEIPLMYRDRP